MNLRLFVYLFIHSSLTYLSAFGALVHAARWEMSGCEVIQAPVDSPTRGDYAVCVVTVYELKGFRFRYPCVCVCVCVCVCRSVCVPVYNSHAHTHALSDVQISNSRVIK